ncbi:MAG: hypothetical protein ACP5HS_13045 [Anaerolineae bacterium]
MIEQWLLLILYVAIGLANVVRGVMAFVVAPILTDLSLPLPVLGVVYLLYGVGFVSAGLIFLMRTGPFARRLVQGVALAYQLTFWLIRLLGVRSATARSLWPRDLFLTIAFLLVVFALTVTATARTRSRHHE